MLDLSDYPLLAFLVFLSSCCFASGAAPKRSRRASQSRRYLVEPPIQFTEGFRCQRIKPTLPVRAHRDKFGFAQNAQMPRDTRLLNFNFCDKVVNLMLSRSERLEDLSSRGVSQNLWNKEAGGRA